MDTAREVALKVLYQIEAKDAYANLALSQALKQKDLNQLERGLTTELVHGVTRTRNTLDWILEQYVKSGLKKLTPWIRNILRLGVYQLYYLDKIPPSAAVNESVKLAKKYGHAGTVKLVNGVLRNVERGKMTLKFPDLATQPVEHISIKYSHPDWLVEKWLKEFGVEETIKLCQANNRPATNSIRTNTLKITRAELKEVLAGEGVECKESYFTPEGLIIDNFSSLEELSSFRKGYFLLQDEGSMLVSHLLKPEARDFIIDACAAPGTKATHLAQLAEDQGRIVACDVHEHKINLIMDNCRRLGIKSITPRVLDARKLGLAYAGQAQGVLVDAPCSGLGVLRRRSDARWRKEPGQLAELSALQLEILQGTSSALKPGGALVYSTCSIAPEENLGVVEKFLKQNPHFRLESILDLLPFALERQEDRETAKEGYLQFLPHIHGTDGFFMARMVRTH